MSSSRPPKGPQPKEPEEGSADDELAEGDVAPPDPPSDPDGAGAEAVESGDDSTARAPSAASPPGEARAAAEVAPAPSAGERAYRNERLSDRGIHQRIGRRYAKDLGRWGFDPLEFLSGVVDRALRSQDFPRGHEAMFPWIYRHGNSELQQMGRRAERDAGRTVPLAAFVDVPAAAAPSLSDEAARRLDVVHQLAANDSGARRALDLVAAHAVDGDSWDAIGEQRGATSTALRKEASRFFARAREAAARHRGKTGAVTTLLLVGLLVGVYDDRRHRMDASHDTIQVATGPDVMPRLTPPDDTSLRLAAVALRDDGLKSCAARAWDACVTQLDGAAQLDPRLASDPVVVKARETAIRAREAKGPGAP